MEKQGFTVFQLLLSEGTAEFNLFAYITKNKFSEEFESIDTKFSNKVEIIAKGEQIVSQGKLGGVSDIKHFRSKHNLIKSEYKNQPLFYFIDMDVDDSSEIGELILRDGHIVQFIEYNTEYMLLSLDGKNPRTPTDFANLKAFRDYCKSEFVNEYGKCAHKFKDSDFEKIFKKCSDEEIRASFPELFSFN